jgi:hypothetical protein
MQTEPMLFVDHGEREIVERNAPLHERVRPDHQIDRAVLDPLRDTARAPSR